MNSSLNLIFQNVGTNWAVGIECPLESKVSEENSRKFIEEAHNSFYNHEATGGELRWETDRFAWFWAPPEKFQAGLVNIERAKLENKMDKGLNRSKDSKKEFTKTNSYIEKLAKASAEAIFQGMKMERFLGNIGANTDFFSQMEQTAPRIEED